MKAKSACRLRVSRLPSCWRQALRVLILLSLRSLLHRVEVVPETVYDIGRIRVQSDAGRPSVVAEPDSDVTKCYLKAATAVRQALAGQGDSVVRQFPEIKISDD